MDSKWIKRLTGAVLFLGLTGLTAGAYAGNSDSGSCDKDKSCWKPPVQEETYDNCYFFDKVFFSYAVSGYHGSTTWKDYDVILSGHFNDLTDLRAAVVNKLKKIAENDDSAISDDISDAKVRIKDVDLAVSCKY